ncbi:Dual specificity protein phosphatase 23-like Protein [Tribolium castaneum]|uniref:Dual specificity protein phosphatase 23 n=1 Tax=Tribolium castaneum TaxID=7070 RepID=D6WSR9_TRICA|nr:PREDICTED: dual specificity protein phosphatase 23 [Tribolium castaneum]EFA06651.2 Dual specificity protein phosphatase 23-like Protein [Tribolium castaneum]|eukprot:XP_008195342.1 PREDICTED: dual specificity protein phosphatase 23 [Tribolium castaneum]
MSEFIKPPYNFSWLVEKELACMAWPQSVYNLEFLRKEGISHLVTLSPEKIPPIVDFPQIEWTRIDIEEFEAPTLDDIIKFIEICEKCKKNGQAVGVHCRMGRGRTGVMAACYLVRFQDFAPEKAITSVRLQRTGSIETSEQERAVVRYRDYLRGTKI